MHIVRFKGGFANQLFQLCLYEKLKSYFGEEKVYADISHYKVCHDHGGFKLAKKVKLNYARRIPEEYIDIQENKFDLSAVSDDKNYYYNGYWQSEDFFPENLEFLDAFFDANNLSKKNRHILIGMRENNSVSVHIRRGDYLDNYMHGNIATKAYIINAMKYMSDCLNNPTFYVFSDDIKWCRENISDEEGNVVYVTGNEECVENDMLMMSNCKHNIIANSSFSWWAQKLNKYEKKIVISPEYWFNQTVEVDCLLSDKFVKCSNLPTIKSRLENPRFSVIVPVFNSAETLNRCASSILNQSLSDIEVIFVDDASTDSSFEKLDQYKKNDARISIVHKEENESLLQARIAGMKKAQGDYILFVDSDDYLDNRACETLNKVLNEVQPDIIEYGFIREPLKVEYREESDFDHRIESILNSTSSHCVWNKCYSAKLIGKALESADAFYCNMTEDVYLSVLFFYKADGYARIDDILYHYVDTNGMSNTKRMSLKMLENAIVSVDNKNKHLRTLLSGSQKYMDLLESNINNDTERLVSLCLKQEISVLEKIEMLSRIDEHFGTKYARQYQERLDEGYCALENFYEKSFFSQTKVMAKYFVKRIKMKFNSEHK